MCESQHLLVADFQLQSSQAELLTSSLQGHGGWLAPPHYLGRQEATCLRCVGRVRRLANQWPHYSLQRIRRGHDAQAVSSTRG